MDTIFFVPSWGFGHLKFDLEQWVTSHYTLKISFAKKKRVFSEERNALDTFVRSQGFTRSSILFV